MSLWIITVEAWDTTGNGDYYEVATLSETERGARKMATRAVGQTGKTGAHSVDAKMVNSFIPKAVLIARKEVAHDQALGAG